MDIKKVAVLGANGQMGSGSGAILARKYEVTFLAQDLDKAKKGLEAALKASRASSLANNIKLATYNDLEKVLPESDWVFEALKEDLAVKKEYFAKIDALRKKGSLVSSVTSGLSINELFAEASEDMQQHALGIHLFNPPAMIVGTEVIPGKNTKKGLVQEVVAVLENELGRQVILAEDTPGFAGNRVGFKVLNEVAQLARYQGVAMMDYLLGEWTGRSMPPLVTADFVGLDVHKAIVDNIYQNTNDEARENFKLPDYLQFLIKKGCLGRKTGAGLYKRVRKGEQRELQEIYARELDENTETMPYFPAEKPKLAFVKEIKSLHKEGRYRDAFRAFLQEESLEADISKKVLFGYISYALNRVGEVVKDTGDIDRIMCYGWNWAPPSALVDLIGRDETIKWMEHYQLSVPMLLKQKNNASKFCTLRGVDLGRYFLVK